MSTPASPAADLDAAPSPDWARALADRQLAVLGDLAELGLDVARTIERQSSASAARDAAAEVQGMGLAYARVARAVRLTIALQSKRIEDLQALEARAQADEDETEAYEELLTPINVRKARVSRIVERVAEAEYENEGADAADDALDRLLTEADERLDDEDVYGDLLERPMSEIVARLCRDLGLSPDWAALSDELWAREEIDSGPPGAPLAALVRARRTPSAPDAAPSPAAPPPTPPPEAPDPARPEARRPSAHGRETAPPP
jgi:hypothetical protein